MISKKTLSAALCATVISLCAMGQHQAMAGFGELSHAADIGLAKSIRNNPQPGQLHQMMEVFGAHMAEMASITEPLRAICGQISDQLAGNGPVDTAQLDALAEQAFPLRAQADMLDLTRQIDLRLVTTPAQIAEAYDLNQHTVALNARFNGVLSLPRYTTSVYLPSDLFGDNLGYTRGLNLTEDQYSRMDNIRAGNAAALEAIQQRRHAVRQQIAEQMGGAGAVTVAGLVPLQQQESALKDQLDMLRLNMTIEIRALLTPEQLARAADLHQQLSTLHAQETAAERAAMDQARSTN